MGESLAVTHTLMLNPHISTPSVVVNRIQYMSICRFYAQACIQIVLDTVYSKQITTVITEHVLFSINILSLVPSFTHYGPYINEV